MRNMQVYLKIVNYCIDYLFFNCSLFEFGSFFLSLTQTNSEWQDFLSGSLYFLFSIIAQTFFSGYDRFIDLIPSWCPLTQFLDFMVFTFVALIMFHMLYSYFFCLSDSNQFSGVYISVNTILHPSNIIA